MRTSHEKADNILVQQMVMVSKLEHAGISVMSDDTDVFVLLLHYYLKEELTGVVVMESPVQERVVVDICETVKANKSIIPDLLSAHALSGCDTVACCSGIGKKTSVKMLQEGYSLSSVGDVSASFTDVTKQATKFMCACYGYPDCDAISEARQKSWAKKTGKGSSSIPKLCSLTPTTEAFAENVKRAHLQACIWKAAHDADPPQLDPAEFGFTREMKVQCQWCLQLFPKILLLHHRMC